MGKMGFAKEWIDTIMQCVTSVYYSISINGRCGEIFCPLRGLPQGDPLSPFLFLIYSKGFSALMHLATKKGI